jgi:hypothetical protein
VTVSKELSKYKLDLVELQEGGDPKLAGEYTFLNFALEYAIRKLNGTHYLLADDVT